MTFATDSNRPQPLWQPPPAACRTASRAASEVPSLLLHPWGGEVPIPLCDIPSGCCSFTGPWTVTRSSLRMLRRVATFCRPLWPVLLLVSFPRSRSPVVGVLGLCWMRHGVPFACQRRPIVGVLRMCWLLSGSSLLLHPWGGEVPIPPPLRICHRQKPPRTVWPPLQPPSRPITAHRSEAIPLSDASLRPTQHCDHRAPTSTSLPTTPSPSDLQPHAIRVPLTIGIVDALVPLPQRLVQRHLQGLKRDGDGLGQPRHRDLLPRGRIPGGDARCGAVDAGLRRAGAVARGVPAACPVTTGQTGAVLPLSAACPLPIRRGVTGRWARARGVEVRRKAAAVCGA